MKHSFTLLTTLLLTPLAVLTAAEKKNDRPNIVFILADDLGAHDLGCFGSTFYETPNIDRLSKRGTRFTQAYAASPLCSPTRSSILVGQYPARTGITAPVCHLPTVQLEKSLSKNENGKVRLLDANSLTRLKPEYFTLAEAFKEAGYATAHFGKWHLGHNLKPGEHYEPMDQGFDSDFPHAPNVSGPGGGGYLAPWKFIKDPTITDTVGMHIEDRMSKEAAKYIQAHKDQPFYLNYWAYSVHSPWNARADYIEHFKAKADPKNPQHNALYAAMVKSLDDGVGRILQAVDDAGIADNTIIVFYSDNGGYAYPPGKTDPEGYSDIPATSNRPLRSGKASLYEGGTREPFIFAWPGKAKAGATSDILFQSVDFYPTLLSCVGLKPHADLKLDGLDQSQALLGGDSARDRIFCHFPHGDAKQASVMDGFYAGTYVRKGDWKLIRFYARHDDGSDALELYDLKNDLGEQHNLAGEKRELVRELNDLISGFLKDTEAVVPKLNPNHGKAPVTRDEPLAGWKNRNCAAVMKDGILTANGTGTAPFLGIGANLNGPAKISFRMKAASGGEGSIELVPKANAKPEELLKFAYTLKGGDWQDINVDLPNKSGAAILRIYLPHASEPVDIDWINVKPEPGKSTRWDF
jgi:arylsulfatase A-like enzyme